jgi:hypothetical protein
MRRVFYSETWTGRRWRTPCTRRLSLKVFPLFALEVGYHVLEDRYGVTLFARYRCDAPGRYSWHRRYSWILKWQKRAHQFD